MTPLKQRIITRIQAEGPMSVAAYMAACLFDPTHGFYPTRDPLGAEGDFITAPEISQMFGEMIGLWCVQSWMDMGQPQTINLIELGPGRGVMMNDILRAARIAPKFIKAARVTLIEASAALQAVQGQTLANSPCPVTWADGLEKSPRGAALIIGNEFLDCLPIRQFVRKNGAWHERLINIDPDDETGLIFGLSELPYAHDDVAHFPQSEDGALCELCPALAQITDHVKLRVGESAVRALFIDYGPAQTQIGDTLQAIKRHTKVDPLSEPGEADLTARVDFGHLFELAAAAKLHVAHAVTQAHFLTAMGIEMRALNLSKAKPEAAPKIARQLARLTDSDQMGTLFKAIAFQNYGLPPIVGLEP